MLGLSWTELLVIGVVALIVIGPKDLPIMMRRIGEFAGQVRRMGAEFQRELARATATEEIRDLKKSITEPLRQANSEITSQFNRMTPTGMQPTGALKPTDPKAESVVDTIKAQAGMTVPAATAVATAPGIADPAPKTSAVGDGAITNPAFALSPPPKVTPTAPKMAAAPAEPADVTPAKVKRPRKSKAAASASTPAEAPAPKAAAAKASPARAPRVAKPAAAKAAPAKAASAKAPKPASAKVAKPAPSTEAAIEIAAEATSAAPRRPRARKAG